MAQDDLAIVVGISLYPGFQNLLGPVNDATAFVDWLKGPDAAVPDAKITKCVTSMFHPPGPNGVNDAHPVEDQINDLFRPLVQQAAVGAHIGRRLYIYMAGHGFSDPADMRTAALYAANAETLFAPHVTATAYAEFFRRSAVFDEIALIMDCCRLAGLLQGVRNPPLPNIAPRAAAAAVRTFYAFGASWGMASREKVFGPDVRGIFTVTLLEALERCEPDSHNRVTGQMVKNYVHNRIDSIAGDVKVDPPEIPVDSARDVTFAVRSAGPLTTVSLKAPAAWKGSVIRLSDSAGEVFRTTIQGKTVQTQVRPGLYKVRVAAFDLVKYIEVTGDEIEIEL